MSDEQFGKRPWGEYHTLGKDSTSKIKHIVVWPDQRLSLQTHEKRAEHWVIISGIGLVTIGEEETPCAYGDTFHIGKGVKHRIANTGEEPLRFIEVQTGEYFGEDDIVRIEDDYQR